MESFLENSWMERGAGVNLLRFKYFLTAAKYESFSEAARELYTSQPNISRQIKLLEESIGFKLFDRSGSSITLTDAGRFLFGELRNIPDIIDQAFSRAKEISSSGQTALMIGSVMVPSIALKLGNAIRVLFGDDLGMGYELELGSFAQMRNGLISRRYDMAFLYTFDIADIRCKTEYKVITRQSAAIAVKKEHPLAGYREVSLTDFKDDPFVVTSPNESLKNYNAFIKMCSERGFTPKIAKTVTTIESMLLSAELGLGVCLVDANASLTENDSLTLVPIGDEIYSELAAVWREDNHDPRIKQIADFLSE